MREEIQLGEKNKDHHCGWRLRKCVSRRLKKTRGPRYTPLSRRQDRPNAILWLVRNHPELKDAQIMRLVGTTKTTLQAIRDRTHWNSSALAPLDPVTLGLCSQIDLDFEVNRAAKDRPAVADDRGQTLVSAEVSTARPRHSPSTEAEVFGSTSKPRREDDEGDIDVASVFSKLRDDKHDDEED